MHSGMKCQHSHLGRTLVDFVVMDFLVLYSSGQPCPSHINNKAHFEGTGFLYEGNSLSESKRIKFNTLRTGDADFCFYITTVQDG